MKTTEEFCPNCCIDLINDRKKLGKGSSFWLVCPKCGYRTKLGADFEDPFTKIKKELEELNIEEEEDYI